MLAVSSSNALGALRNSTRAEHEAIESDLRIAKPGAQKPDFTAYIAAFYGWLEPIESVLYDNEWMLGLSPALRSRKSEWLHQDLLSLGLNPGEIEALPRFGTSIDISSSAACLGTIYVIEGAQLGGRVLRKRLSAEQFARDSRWLEGYGDQTGRMWTQFVNGLEERLSEYSHVVEATSAAVLTFKELRAWFWERGAAG
jgi:heme oxygenase